MKQQHIRNTNVFYRWEEALPQHTQGTELFENNKFSYYHADSIRWLQSVLVSFNLERTIPTTSASLLCVDLVTIQDRGMQLNTVCCQFPPDSAFHINTT